MNQIKNWTEEKRERSRIFLLRAVRKVLALLHGQKFENGEELYRIPGKVEIFSLTFSLSEVRKTEAATRSIQSSYVTTWEHRIPCWPPENLAFDATSK